MRKIKSIVFISILALFTACNSKSFEEHEIGGNLINQSTEVFMIDTFTVEGATVKLDSVTTSGFKDFLLGKYEDPYLGNVESDFYGVVDLVKLERRSVNKEEVFVEFDSLIFIMYHEPKNPRLPKYTRFIGDTLAAQTISVHRITEEFKIKKNKSPYKAHDKLMFEEEALGSSTFIPRIALNSVIGKNDKDPESKKGGIRIRLDDALGLEIIDKVNSLDKKINDILKDRVKWLNYFRGIVLKADENNSAVFSFQTGVGMKMRLYYHDRNSNQSGMLRFHDFPVTASSLNFTNHDADFMSATHPLVQQINDLGSIRDSLGSGKIDDLCFIQGGTGLMTKVRIPYVKLLNRMGLTGGILKAELVFSPESNSYDKDLYPLPSSNFELYSTNKKNLFLSGVKDPRTNKQLVSRYVYNYKYIGESYYSFDITSYVNNILLNGQEYDNALLITLPLQTLGNSVERLVIDNRRNSDTRIKLEVTYVVQN